VETRTIVALWTLAVLICGAIIISPWVLSNSRPKCESAEVVATVKDMALRKLNGPGGDTLLPRIDSKTDYSLEDLSIDSYIERGNIGRSLNCAAQIKNLAVTKTNIPVGGVVSIEYKIETTDGKTMVSARFRPKF
jgi:hypothetical protein